MFLGNGGYDDGSGYHTASDPDTQNEAGCCHGFPAIWCPARPPRAYLRGLDLKQLWVFQESQMRQYTQVAVRQCFDEQVSLVLRVDTLIRA